MPVRQAILWALVAILAIFAITYVVRLGDYAFDAFEGKILSFVSGAENNAAASISSGAVGDKVHAILFASGLFVAIPTFVWSACQFHSKR
jgi:hypothetical protein